MGMHPQRGDVTSECGFIHLQIVELGHKLVVLRLHLCILLRCRLEIRFERVIGGLEVLNPPLQFVLCCNSRVQLCLVFFRFTTRIFVLVRHL